ncbi:hypothetical protein [Paenibacillus thiaminolyticus]|uniref:hypothetical protein n=1 Tax=Paenibacillus thiaminolyticus TaxID=49283 RepID=UPI00197D8257|nr:hypothetical protein [Paenibacillus thiaminolyticus]
MMSNAKFNPDESIEILKALIEASGSKEAKTVEIPLEEARQILNNFRIMKHQADSMNRTLGELKEMADQGRLVRVEDNSFKGFSFTKEEQERINKNFPSMNE